MFASIVEGKKQVNVLKATTNTKSTFYPDKVTVSSMLAY